MADNDFSTNVLEAIDSEIGQQLELRRENIPNYELYGPPDLCYFIKEKSIS